MADVISNMHAEPLSVTAFSALKFVKLDHEQHLQLCDSLEDIADSLPDRIDAQQCVVAAAALRNRVNVHHQLEEHVLFPRLMARARGDKDLHKILERLADEHRTDEGHCEEAIELLSRLSHGIVPNNVEAAGYMLRGLFEGLRRHIAFENDHVLPIAHQILQQDDLEALASEIRRTLHPRSAASYSH